MGVSATGSVNRVTRRVLGGAAIAGICFLVPFTAGMPIAAASAASLPTGAATSFPFGSINSGGAKVSLPPSGTKDVNQGRVAAAPRVGPFKFTPNGSPSTWPNACQLTNKAQLHALEPSITGVISKSGQKAELLFSGKVTPHNTDCKFTLNTSFEPKDEGGVDSWVEIQLSEIDSDAPSSYQQQLADQQKLAKKYPAQWADYAHLKNGVKCFYDGNELQCLKGDVDYWVLGQKVTSGDLYSVDQAVWLDQIVIPLAEVLGAELKTVS